MSVIGKGKVTTQKGWSCTSTAGKVLDPNPNRIRATFVNDSATEVYFGPTIAVTAVEGDANQGIPLVQNAELRDDDTNGTWYCITASGTATGSATEVS